LSRPPTPYPIVDYVSFYAPETLWPYIPITYYPLLYSQVNTVHIFRIFVLFLPYPIVDYVYFNAPETLWPYTPITYYPLLYSQVNTVHFFRIFVLFLRFYMLILPYVYIFVTYAPQPHR
jgi:hypothetical protein